MVSAGGWGGAGIQGHVVRGHENTLSTAPPPVLASLGSAQSPFTTSLQRARGSGLGQAWALAPLAHTLDVSPGPKDQQGAVLSGTVLSPCIFEGVPTGTDEAPLHWAVRKAGVRGVGQATGPQIWLPLNTINPAWRTSSVVQW